MSKAIGAAKGKGEDVAALMAEVAGLADELKANEAALAGVQARYTDLALAAPDASPDAAAVADNVLVQPCGAGIDHVIAHAGP